MSYLPLHSLWHYQITSFLFTNWPNKNSLLLDTLSVRTSDYVTLYAAEGSSSTKDSFSKAERKPFSSQFPHLCFHTDGSAYKNVCKWVSALIGNVQQWSALPSETSTFST